MSKYENASLRLKVYLRGYYNFEIGQKVLIEIPSWKGMLKYGGFGSNYIILQYNLTMENRLLYTLK
jgi:hypothetical protein